MIEIIFNIVILLLIITYVIVDRRQKNIEKKAIKKIKKNLPKDMEIGI